MSTNISFLQKFMSHKSFEDGDLETHFIENHREEPFVDSSDPHVAKEAYDNARFGAFLVATCICEKDHSNLEGSMSSLLKSYSYLAKYM